MNGTRSGPRAGLKSAPATLGMRRADTTANVNSSGGKQSHIKVTVRIRPLHIKRPSYAVDADGNESHFSSTTTLAPQQLAENLAFNLSSHEFLLQQHHAHHRRTVSPIDEQLLVFDPIGATAQVSTPIEHEVPSTPMKGRVPGGRKHKNICYGFDRVFPEDCSQQDVYEATTKPLIEGVLDGYNSTVFAYGATGCGKTYTITGTAEEPGVIYRTMEDLFARMRELDSERVIEAELSYLEVYNEQIRDLLKDQAPLDLREDDKGVQVMKLSKHVLLDVDDVMSLLIRGNENRSKAPTEANETSSRSHAVLQIHVKQRDRASGTQTTWKTAILSIIDLAGSERASATKNRGDRLREGAKINRSLLALGNCINALCKSVNSRHIPYRDSKLTRLLKFSLGGNCKVVMIANVSPHQTYYEETHNTLMYANRAKEIKTKVEQNRVNVEAGVEEYKNIISELEDQVRQLRDQLQEARSLGVRGDPSGAKSVFEQITGSRGLQFLRNRVFPELHQHELIRESISSEINLLKHHSDLIESVKGSIWGSEYEVELSSLKAATTKHEADVFQRLQQEHGRLRDCEGAIDDLEKVVQKVAQRTRDLLASRDLEAAEDSWTISVFDELIAMERFRILKEITAARDRDGRTIDTFVHNRTDRLVHTFTNMLASNANLQTFPSTPSKTPSRTREKVSLTVEDGAAFLQDLLANLDERPSGLQARMLVNSAAITQIQAEAEAVVNELRNEETAPVLDTKLFATALREKGSVAELRNKRTAAVVATAATAQQGMRPARSQLVFGSTASETGMAAAKSMDRINMALKGPTSSSNRRAISDTHSGGPIRISSPQRRNQRKITPLSRANSAEEPILNPPLPDAKRALAAVANAVRNSRDQWERPWRTNAQPPAKAESSGSVSTSLPNLNTSLSRKPTISPEQSSRTAGSSPDKADLGSDRIASIDGAAEAEGRKLRSKNSSPIVAVNGSLAGSQPVSASMAAVGGPGSKRIWK